MRALVTTGDAENPVRLEDVEPPTPGRAEALVTVHAVSLNRGEVMRARAAAAGVRLGWDVAGVIERAAGDGSGPAAGTRVVGLLPQAAWAESVAVPTEFLAALPGGISFAQASALPVAGLTALRTLAVGGLLTGRRVLVTGAAGGVGRFAVQLASAAGAHVTGVTGSPERARGLRDLGADEIVHDVSGGPYDLVLESAGGESLARAMEVVAPRGTVVSFGRSSNQDASVRASWYIEHPGARLRSFFLFDELSHTRSAGRDLRTLADLVAAGRLDCQVSLESSWTDAQPVIRALWERRVNGKAVLRLRGDRSA